jgi:hypothetical protein
MYCLLLLPNFIPICHCDEIFFYLPSSPGAYPFSGAIALFPLPYDQI